jgi:serine/threonine protein kinase
MAEPNLPNDGTRKRPPNAPPNLAGDPATGPWDPSAESDVELVAPSHVGQYEVKAVLGTGTYGRVFLAFDPAMRRQVAIKQPYGEGLKPEYREDFLKEAQAAAAIEHHANICPVYHVGTDNGLPFIVMRFVAGGTLKSFLERRAELLSTRAAVSVARKIALGLAAAHGKGIIHRDLKPANVLVDDENNQVLITDFGLARITSRAQAAASLHRGAHGTPFYMPPEQWGSQSFGPITPVADVYSLGVILFEMLTGQPPFSGSQFELMTRHCTEAPRLPSSLRFGLDPRLDAICLKALEKQPAGRYRSAKEFADVLTEYLRGGGAMAAELIEAIPVGENLDGPAPRPARPAPPPLPWAEPLPESPRYPRRPGYAPPSDSTAELPEASTIEEKEVVRCPKCNSRLEIAVRRTRPIDCPMCALKFAVEAGRQAAARASRTAERERPQPAPQRSRRDDRRDDRRERDRRERRDDREDRRERDRYEDDGTPAWHWKPAARGLRLAWLGMVFSMLCAFLLIATGIAAAGSDNPSSSSSNPPSSTFKSTTNSKGEAPPRPSDSGVVFQAAATLLGVGLAAGIFVMGVGRLRAARVPEGVRGGTAATISAVAGWAAAVCAAVPFLLIYSMVEESRRPTGSGHTTLTGAATIAGCAAVVFMLVGEFAANSYYTAIGRRLRDFPRALVTVAKVLVWIMLVALLLGAAFGGIAAAAESPNSSSHKPFYAALGLVTCLVMLLLPVWGVITLWLNVHAAVAIGRHAHSAD